MFYEKRYLQFNNLVFDGYDMIRDYDEPIQYKGSSTSYSYGHGSYRPRKAEYNFVSERQVNMTITLKLKKVPCEYREFYAKFAEQELQRSGRLWAIKNNEIIWAYADINNIRPINSYKQNEIEWDVEFIIPSGVWYKADKKKTFLLPYDVCLFMDCKGYQNIDPCEEEETSGDCCLDCLNKKSKRDAKNKESCDCCCTDQLCNDMALCYHTKELQEFYTCDTPYQLVYDCTKAELYNNGVPLGQRVCTRDSCTSKIAGRFYSETDIPTTEVGLVIEGVMKNPAITINGNMNYIKGEYDGLRIAPSGDVFAITNCCEKLLEPSVWGRPASMNYGWTVYPKENSIIVDLGACCSKACVYIQDRPITT